MSRESNYVSLQKAVRRSFAEPRLFGYQLAEVGALLLVAVVLYAITLRLLVAKFGVSFEILMTYFAQDALPPTAAPLILLMVGIGGVVLLLLGVFFEAGIFSLIRKKEFFAGAKKAFVSFLVIVIVFEILDFLSTVFLLPTRFWPWWEYIGLVIVFLLSLLFFVWRMLAQFVAVQKGPVVSLKESWKEVTGRLGHWGRALFTVIVVILEAVVVAALFAGLTYLIHPYALVLGALVALLLLLWIAVVVRIFFWQRMNVK